MQGNAPDEEYTDEHGECRAEIEMLSRIVYYYASAGWPRYTEREVPHVWPDGGYEVQSRALDRVRKLHLQSLGGTQEAPKSNQPQIDVREFVKTLK